MSGAVAVSRRGLARGLVSRAFPPAAAERAALHLEPHAVFVDVDSEGYLCAAGAGGAAGASGAVRASGSARAGGAERVAARARLAPHVHAANVVVTRDGELVRLRVERAAAPLDELLLWFHEDLLAAIDMPFLTLRNIRGRKEYECEECGARFEEPNPLKTHLFLRCAAATAPRLWRAVAARLAAAPPDREPASAAASAFRRVPPRGPCEDDAWAARLEAAAAEWGRARGGHTCLYCGKLYSRKYGLKIHLRTHTGYRPLRCRHCSRAFGDPSNLNKHVRLHAAAPAAARGPHACSRCGKALARRRDLERHMRAHCARAERAAPAP